MATLHFTYKKDSRVPRLIKHFSRSNESKSKKPAKPVAHVSLECQGVIGESNHKEGVILLPTQEWMNKYRDAYVCSREIYGLDEDLVLERMKAEEGKGYDWLILFCYPFYCDYQDKNRWGCSEIAAYWIQEYMDHDQYHRFNPLDLKAVGTAHMETYRRLST